MSTDDELFFACGRRHVCLCNESLGTECFFEACYLIMESKVLSHEVLAHVQGFFECHPIPVVLGVRVREPLAIGLSTSSTARADEIVEVLLCLGEFHVSSP